MKRDLHADLALCEAASPGPWKFDKAYGDDVGSIECIGDIVMDFGAIGEFVDDTIAGTAPSDEDLAFILEAREGWPEAIERAIAAESVLERIRTCTMSQFTSETEMLRYIKRAVMGVSVNATHED